MRLPIAAMVLVASTTAAAQPMRDADFGEGTVARAAYLATVEARFDTLDANHDGRLEPKELAAERRAGGEREDRQGSRADGAGAGRHRGSGGMGAGMGEGGGMRGRHREGGYGGTGGGLGYGGRARPQSIKKADFIVRRMRLFDLMDDNQDGSLTKAERDAFRARFGAGNSGAPVRVDPSELPPVAPQSN